MPSDDSLVWPWSRTTLYRFMKSTGFVYGDRLSHYEHTKRRADIVSMRDNYLDWIAKYRTEGYRIYYQDETWVFKNMTCSKVWRNILDTTTDETFKVPSGKGDRNIVSHIGSAETGLLPNCLLLFRGSKSNKSADYHTEMNWNVFSHWCRNKVFPEIRKTGIKSVVILDRATYHTVLDDDDRWPVTSWTKRRLSDAIIRWGGPPSDWLPNWESLKVKQDLLIRARSIYPSPKYKIQKIADEFSSEDFCIKILFLPVAHPELNPIELVWGNIKRAVASRNLLFNLSWVEEETREQLSKVDAEKFKSYVNHAIREENSYKNLSVVDTE